MSKVTADSVVLSWQQTGPYRSVLVRYRAIDSGTTAMCEETYERPRRDRVTVTGLSGLTDYEFYVVLVNGAGCSQASGPQYATTDRSGTAGCSSADRKYPQLRVDVATRTLGHEISARNVGVGESRIFKREGTD